MASGSSQATVREITGAINAATSEKGGVYGEYSCCSVSWDDACRGTVGDALSCVGPNITDSRLWAKDGTLLYTVRTNNWNEKLGEVSTDDIALVAGNHAPGDRVVLQPVTLRTFLKNIGTYGGYAGLPPDADLSSDEIDKKVSIRFQTTFLPVPEDKSDLGTLEFCTEAYNYQTMSKEDPRNVLLLCTTQGTAVQQDGPGAQKLYHHAVDPEGRAHAYYLEAEQSTHKVGGAQVETKEEAEAAAARGKATASVIGIKAMGTRFNVLMTIQLPVKQKQVDRGQYFPMEMLSFGSSGAAPSPVMQCCAASAAPLQSEEKFFCAEMAPAMCAMEECDEDAESCDDYVTDFADVQPPPPPPPPGMCPPCPPAPKMAFASSCPAPPAPFSPFAQEGMRMKRAQPPKAAPRKGRAHAARVSRGSHVGLYEGLTKLDAQRDAAQHPTITCVIFNTVAGGIPSVEDVLAAIDDMEALYAATGSGRLADAQFDFAKQELTVKHVQDVAHKVAEQPYTPAPGPGNLVANGSVFPK